MSWGGQPASDVDSELGSPGAVLGPDLQGPAPLPVPEPAKPWGPQCCGTLQSLAPGPLLLSPPSLSLSPASSPPAQPPPTATAS